MANPWFRMYSEFADDPKVQMMSEQMQRRLVMLFCSRCKGETLHETELAFHWRVSTVSLEETKAMFIEKGFIDEHWNLLNWNARQFLSDSSTERVHRFRSKKKQSETLHETVETVTVTPPEQNRTEQNRTYKTSSADAEAVYVEYPRKIGKANAIKAISKALKTVEKPALIEKVRMFAKQCKGKDMQYVPHAATWFNGQRWEDESLQSLDDRFKEPESPEEGWPELYGGAL